MEKQRACHQLPVTRRQRVEGEQLVRRMLTIAPVEGECIGDHEAEREHQAWPHPTRAVRSRVCDLLPKGENHNQRKEQLLTS